MKIALLFPKSLSLAETFKHGFEQLGHQPKIIDYQEYISKSYYKINSQIFRFPYFIKKRWYINYFRIIESSYRNLINENPADLFFVYNSQMLTPDLVSYIKSKDSKIIFFMGDSPYYTKTNQLYINILFQADYIFAPDTHWIDELYMLGISKVDFLMPGFNPQVYKKIEPSVEEKEKYETNCVFIGLNYDSSLGFKRSLFLSKFSKFGLSIYGSKDWDRWIERFPELKPCFKRKNRFIPDEEWNLICNCAKMQPVDANPGLMHGIHIRIFDSIGSGILPVAEYRKDMDRVFPNNILPIVKSYNEIDEIATYYLNNPVQRERKIIELHTHVMKNYNNINACKQIVNALK